MECRRQTLNLFSFFTLLHIRLRSNVAIEYYTKFGHFTPQVQLSFAPACSSLPQPKDIPPQLVPTPVEATGVEPRIKNIECQFTNNTVYTVD
jgi:hypothetical protein